MTLLDIKSKIFEKFLFKAIAACFADKLTDVQFGFLPGRSIILQLILSLSRIYENIGCFENTNLLFLFDFSKAYDKIKHEILLKKLLNLGISEELFLLLRDYLLDRTQRVRINSEISTDKRINSGVQQGSVLGPLLFLLYLKDLLTVIFSSQAF